MHTMYLLSIHFHCQNTRKRSKLRKKKMSKINIRIISKSCAHLQSMVKIYVKFQINQDKTVGGFAHKKYPLSILLSLSKCPKNDLV